MSHYKYASWLVQIYLILNAEGQKSSTKHHKGLVKACSKHKAGTFIRRRCMNKALIIIFREIGVPKLCFNKNFCKITM